MKRAVVAGGSLAGLLAARVLHDFADEVVIIEPDTLPDTPLTRAGTPQANQFHVLLGLAQHLFGHWFPTLLPRLGAGPYPIEDCCMYLDGATRVAVPGDQLMPVPRPLLEFHVRAEVLALPKVRLVRDRVVGLTIGLGRVDGVRLASGAAVHGELVVDATGRASRLGDWLLRLDFQPPPKQRMDLDLGYATVLYHRYPDQRLDNLYAVHSLRSAGSAEPGVSVVAPSGPDRWICSVSAYGKQRPTKSLADFHARCEREPAAGFAALVHECEPASQVEVHRFPHSARRDFHQLRHFPAGVVPVGDAVASFNPVYGQGMPSAALHASALGAWLRSGDDVHAYFERLKVLVDAAWQTSALADFALPHVPGPRPKGYRVMQAVGTAIDQATTTDPLVAKRFIDVINMRQHPSALLRPDILARAARARIARG
ncbi:FAD-dependent oxidoreductase [Actinokineospora sp. HUAS TT18]|uniref:FAD-dependent oxidoreductase n=1 Tax=Actinokineospora sp. HUAS TT18 TaxID=3447451 RepID=UPI003F51B615